MKRIYCILAALVFSYTLSAGVFDDRFPSAKYVGMGGSGVAMADDVWASYYNPAGLSRLANPQIGSSYVRLFNQSFLQNAFGAVAYPLNSKYGSVSLSFQYFGTTHDNQNLSGEYTFAVSHGFNLLKDITSSLSFGYSLKAYYLDYATSVSGIELGNATTFGLDIGFQASVYNRTTIGFYALNVNTPSVGVEAKRNLPQRVVAGVAYQPYDGVTTSLDMSRTIGVGEMEFWAGTDFQLFNYLSIRFGGTTNPNRYSLGIGLNIHQLNFDYGLRTHSELGETHQVGLMYSF